jgi:hypothetical protein
MGTIRLFEVSHERFERLGSQNIKTLTLESGATEPPGQCLFQSESWLEPTFHAFCVGTRGRTRKVAEGGK